MSRMKWWGIISESLPVAADADVFGADESRNVIDVGDEPIEGRVVRILGDELGDGRNADVPVRSCDGVNLVVGEVPRV